MEIDSSKELFYTAMRLPGRAPFDTYDFEQPLVVPKLATVNIFVGANNSGKSRFLRGLFRSNEFEYKTNFFNGDEFRNFLKGTHSPLATNDVLERAKMIEFDPTLMVHPNKKIGEYFKSQQPFAEQLRALILKTVDFATENRNSFSVSSNTIQALETIIHQYANQWRTRINDASFPPKKVGNELRFYIPILRGMRSFSGTNANEYSQRTISDYFTDLHGLRDESSNWKIFTGLELYTDLKQKLLGEPEERESVRKFEEFLQRQFFDDKTVTLIPREGKEVVHVKIGDEKQLPMHELGDGLQNLIIITYEMFMQKQRCMFFIEEPDLSMHPGMQRALLEVMIQHNQHQYFLTTHSNHLLDMSSEFQKISIYLFAKEVKDSELRFNVKQASSPDINILKELGVHNSSVFLTNATIWVEGITDRLYLRAYLKKFLEQSASKRKFLREDYHYSFVEYQGSNLTHWTFDEKDQSAKIQASYLCGHSFLIADGDVSDKGSRREVYTKMLGDRFHILECKEIENLIPAEVLKRLIKDEFIKAGKDVEKIDYSKYSESEYGLGKYLDELLGKVEFASETGTLKSKVNFCERAVEIMGQTDFDWRLNPQLEALCEKIHQFIQKQNQ